MMNPLAGPAGPGKFSTRTDKLELGSTNRLGPGPGPEVLGMNPATEKLSDVLAKMIPYDQTGEIAILYQRAASRGL